MSRTDDYHHIKNIMGIDMDPKEAAKEILSVMAATTDTEYRYRDWGDDMYITVLKEQPMPIFMVTMLASLGYAMRYSVGDRPHHQSVTIIVDYKKVGLRHEYSKEELLEIMHKRISTKTFLKIKYLQCKHAIRNGFKHIARKLKLHKPINRASTIIVGGTVMGALLGHIMKG